MFIEDELVEITTAGSFFPLENPPIGVWTAGLVWTDDENEAQFDLLHGQSTVVADTGRNIAADVIAVLNGLERALELGRGAIIHSPNESVCKTINEYYSLWRDHKWKTARKRVPDSLEIWHRIKSITDEIDVIWHRRPRGKIDTVKDYSELVEKIEQEDNEFWMRRAIDRDRS